MSSKSISAHVIFSILLPHFALLAQPQVDIEKYRPKRIIDRIEILGGPSVFFPDDHGYTELIDRLSLGTISYGISKKWGYCYGIAISRSIAKRFDIAVRVMKERKGYFEEHTSYDISGEVYSKSKSEMRNDYLTFSILPSFYFSVKKRLQITLGFSTYYITKAIQYPGVYYINGQYFPPGGNINTIDAFTKHEWGLLAGLCYAYPVSKRFQLAIKAQLFYGLSEMIHQNQYTLSGNNLLILPSIRYSLSN